MSMSEQDEILIQKCVDAELSENEEQRLVARLDQVDNGWKQLACGFLEDRALRGLFGNPEADVFEEPVERPAPPMPSSPLRKQQILASWWSHPIVTVGLCLALAFTAGQLINTNSSGNTGLIETALADLFSRGDSSEKAVPAAVAQAVADGNFENVMFRTFSLPDGRLLVIPVR